jgi:hypothetical protein
MKILIDFEHDGPLSRAIAQVLGIVSNTEETASMEEADVVITDSEDKLLTHLQQTEHKVVQFCHSHHHPMSHLIEDYPGRLRVINAQQCPNTLATVLEAISELTKK